MAILVEVVENTFDTGGDDPTVVKQVRVSTPYTATDFFLDLDEAEVLLDGLEAALFQSGFWSDGAFEEFEAETVEDIADEDDK